jgi:hypothetical protein
MNIIVDEQLARRFSAERISAPVLRACRQRLYVHYRGRITSPKDHRLASLADVLTAKSAMRICTQAAFLAQQPLSATSARSGHQNHS